MMIYNRVIDSCAFIDEVFTQEHLVIAASRGDKRSDNMIEKLNPKKLIVIEYAMKLEEYSIVDSFSAYCYIYDKESESNYLSLFEGMDKFVDSIYAISKKIIIDISCLHLRFLGAFLSKLKDYVWEEIYCAYTEPNEYKRIKKNEMLITDKYKGQFDLNHEFYGHFQIPRLETTSAQRKPFKWIVFLGFEGTRPDTLRNEIGKPIVIIPIITVPAIHPGWNNFAYDANQYFFDNSEITCNDLDYLSAINPFSTYNYLVKKTNESQNHRLIVSPLGTRPTSLGILLFAMNNSDCEIIYDTPKLNESNVIECGKICIYDILSFFIEEE